MFYYEVAICTIGMCMILYVSTGLCGYFLFGDSVQENILQNYGTHNQHGVDMPEDWSVTVTHKFELKIFGSNR